MAKREIIVELKLDDKNAVAELGRLEIETKQYQRELRLLNAEIAKNGTATRAQEQAVGTLNASIRRNQTVVRELKNDLSGATAAGLRFRDKMAEASRAGLAEFGLQAASVAAVTTAVIALGKELFTLAGEIEKTDARNRAIAGDSLPRFTEAAEANANALGLTSREYVSLAANQKLALNQLGIEGSLVDDLSIKVVEYADLLGDFSAGTLSTEEATKLLNDALLGKTKGLKELGINMKASKEELDRLKAGIMASRGVTESQAEALANLELAFQRTAEKTGRFADENLNLDRAQDSATARLKDAKEALAVGLTPAFEAATGALAGYTEVIAFNVEKLGAFAGLLSALNIPLAIAGKLMSDNADEAKKLAGDTSLAAKSTDDLEQRLGKLVKLRDDFRAVGKEAAATEGDAEIARLEKEIALSRSKDKEAAEAEKSRTKTIAELRDKLKGLKEARENLLTTDAAGIAQSDKAIAAIEKELKAIDGSAKAIDKKTEAVKKLTAAQLAQFDAESAINIDARSNPFAIEATDQGTFRMPDEVAEVEEGLAAKIAAYDAEQMAFADLQDAKVQAAQAFTATLANLAGEDTEVARALFLLSKLAAVAEVFINLQREIAAYSANPTWSLFPDGGAAIKAKAIAAAKIRAAASIAVIASQGFEEGGFTSKRSSDSEPVGVVHANEYVVPAPILRTRKGKALVDQIEGIRRGLSVRFAPPFVSGGPTRRSGVVLASEGAGGQLRAGGIASADLARAISSMPPPQVSVVEFREVMRRVDVIENLSKA